MPKLYLEAGSYVVPGKQGRGAERVNVPSNPEQLATWLNAFAECHDIAQAIAPAAPSQADAGSFTDADLRSLVEESWDQLPLAFRLHLAALTIEDARAKVKP